MATTSSKNISKIGWSFEHMDTYFNFVNKKWEVLFCVHYLTHGLLKDTFQGIQQRTVGLRPDTCFFSFSIWNKGVLGWNKIFLTKRWSCIKFALYSFEKVNLLFIWTNYIYFNDF